jgi:predicted amidophosphoribosyltransferase
MRLTNLDPQDFRYLVDGDNCWHFGDYTAGGGYGASETNQQIHNLKKSPTSPEHLLRWKRRAISYWANHLLTSNLNFAVCEMSVTFVPMPCSKPEGHAEHDDRILQILRQVAARHPGVDVRPLLRQTEARESQHLGARATPEEIANGLGIDHRFIPPPLRPHVIVVDDVITRGASFAAAKNILLQQPGVGAVSGLFLAKTIHPPIEWDEFPDLDDVLG